MTEFTTRASRAFASSAAYGEGPRTFVLVHGAWHGGWCWKRVGDALSASGHCVYAPTLTGLAERAHLLSPSVGLQTHVNDVSDLLKWEDLHDVVLCGHSYGGMVITGVAEAQPERIAGLVYLDAVIPDSGRSLLDYLGTRIREEFDAAASANGEALPPPSAHLLNVNRNDQAWVDAHCTPHPYQTFRDSLPSVTARDKVPHKACVVAQKHGSSMVAVCAAARRSDPNWRVYDLPHGHDLMIDAPALVAEILLKTSKWL